MACFSIRSVVKTWLNDKDLLESLLLYVDSIPDANDENELIGTFNSGLFSRNIKRSLIEDGELESVLPFPIHISCDGIGMFKHGIDGSVSMMPLYAVPLFAKNAIRNDFVNLLAFFPGPSQQNVDMYAEMYYKEIASLGEGFYEEVGSKTLFIQLILAMNTADYRGLPDSHRHKQEPAEHACHCCFMKGNPPMQRPVKRKREESGMESTIKQGF